MGLFTRLFGGSDPIGDRACKLVLGFLESSDEKEVTASTFTELFSFVYFEIDSVLFVRKIPARESIASSMVESYRHTLQTHFDPSNANTHEMVLNQRIEEYGAMLRSHRQKSDIVEKLDFYLSQASGLSEHHRDGESPVVLGDIFSMVGNRAGLTEFYKESLAPFIKTIIAKHQ
jgi:hypothetical protein